MDQAHDRQTRPNRACIGRVGACSRCRWWRAFGVREGFSIGASQQPECDGWTSTLHKSKPPRCAGVRPDAALCRHPPGRARGRRFPVCQNQEIEVASTGNAAKRPALAAPSGSDTSADVVFWQSIQDSGNADMFRAYLAKFPNGTFAGLAHLRIEELNKASQAATKSKAETSAAAELVFWTSIKDSDQPKGFREYLQQFPGGTFAELAQLRLAELVKQAALSVPQPAASAASADIDTMESAGGGAQTLQNQLFEKTNVASLPSGVETVDEPGANRGFSGTWLWRVNLDGDTYCGGAQTQSMRITNGKILSGVTLRGSNFVVDGTIRKN